MMLQTYDEYNANIETSKFAKWKEYALVWGIPEAERMMEDEFGKDWRTENVMTHLYKYDETGSNL